MIEIFNDWSASLLFNKLWSDRRIRYLVVGGANTVFGWIIFTLSQITIGKQITYFGSLALAFAFGTTTSFILQRKLVYKVNGNFLIDFARFTTVYLPSLVVNALILPIFVSVLSLNVILVQSTYIIFSAVAMYFVHKHFSFKRSP